MVYSNLERVGCLLLASRLSFLSWKTLLLGPVTPVFGTKLTFRDTRAWESCPVEWSTNGGLHSLCSTFL